MIKRILKYNNKEDIKILSQKSEEVLNIENVKNIIQDLKDTLHSVPDAKGISAIQIGENKRICICSWAGKEIVLINPKITHARGETSYLEGCLSVPFTYKKVKRFQKVWCSYIDEDGNEKEISEGGRMSDIIQHELDHFEGKCIIFNDEEDK